MRAKEISLGFATFFALILIFTGIATFVSRPDGLVPPGPEPYYGIVYFVGFTIILFIVFMIDLARR